jgi:Na+/H+-dicarboxylate symporter
VCWRTKFSVKRFVKDYLLYVYPFAWATSSSTASIPINLERTGALGVRKEVREFVIPLGATVNLDGAIIAVFVITPMAAMLVGYRPTLLDLLLLVIPVKLVTLGVPGIPGGVATVVPPLVSEILPIPPDMRATFVAIWFGFSVGLSDQFRTGVNAATNGVVALMFEHWYDRWFARKRDAPASAAQPADVTEDTSG